VQEVGEFSPSQATITIARRTLLQDLVRRYTVFIDGIQVGMLWAFQTGRYQMTPGTHQVRLAITGTGRASSDDVDVYLEPGGVQALRTVGRGIVSLLKLPLALPAGAYALIRGKQISEGRWSGYYRRPWILLVPDTSPTSN
jgi:hypothetical protein